MIEHKLQINHGRIVDPATGTEHLGSLFIENGQIVGVDKQPTGFSPQTIIDAAGLVVAPGFIDLSARGMQSRNELAAAFAGGVTTLCCPPDTTPPLDEPGLVETLRQHAEASGLPNLLPLGALTQGLQGEALAELAALSAAGCIAFSQAGRPIADNRTLRRAMQYASTFGFALWLQPEDPSLAAEGVAHDGEVASRLGLAGIPVSAETVAIHTLIDLARETGARLHLTRLSSAEGVAIIQAAHARGVDVSCDVSAHSLHFSELDIGYFNTHARLSPPLRTPADRRALAAAVASGSIAAICSDHTPVSDDGKFLPFGEAKAGASAIELLLPLTLAFGREFDLPLAATLAKITTGPARIVGSKAGCIALGAPADLCLFDPDEVWQVHPETLKSQGKNTLTMGTHVTGRVRHTIAAGRLVFSAES